jgi:hypothetical protein
MNIRPKSAAAYFIGELARGAEIGEHVCIRGDDKTLGGELVVAETARSNDY